MSNLRAGMKPDGLSASIEDQHAQATPVILIHYPGQDVQPKVQGVPRARRNAAVVAGRYGHRYLRIHQQPTTAGDQNGQRGIKVVPRRMGAAACGGDGVGGEALDEEGGGSWAPALIRRF